MATIRAIGDRVIIEPKTPETKTKGGIILPDNAKEKPLEGKVISVGSGRIEGATVVPSEVKVGDNVLYGKYSGTEIKHEGKEYMILSSKDVLAVLN